MRSPGRPCHVTQTAIFPKRKGKNKLRNNKWNFHIHRKETQDRGSENKNKTAFQVAQKEVPKQAGFLPGRSTSPQLLKPSNSTKTWSILSYRRLCASSLRPPKLQENPIRGQILSSSLDELEKKKKKENKKVKHRNRSIKLTSRI